MTLIALIAQDAGQILDNYVFFSRSQSVPVAGGEFAVKLSPHWGETMELKAYISRYFLSLVSILMVTATTVPSQAYIVTKGESAVVHVIIDGSRIRNMNDVHKTVRSQLLLNANIKNDLKLLFSALTALPSDTELIVAHSDLLEKVLGDEDFENLIQTLRDAAAFDEESAASGHGYYLSVHFSVKS